MLGSVEARIAEPFVRKKDSMKEVDYVNKSSIESLALENKVRMKQLGDHQPQDVCRNESAGKTQLFHQELSTVSLQ